MQDIEVKPVEWLWYPFIPLGKITIVQGDPGEGKTTLLLRIISLLTTGGEFPESQECHEVSNVIYQTAEDGLADTIKPRLLEAKADCSKVMVIDDSEKELTMTDERLEQAIIATNAKLIVLDPIQAYLGAGVDMHRANEVRPIMKRLSVLAEKHGCAVVLIGHMNKATGNNANHRGLGSVDFQAATRSVLIVGRIKDDSEVVCYMGRSPKLRAYLDMVLENKEAWLKRRIKKMREEKQEDIAMEDIKDGMGLKPNTYLKYRDLILSIIEKLNNARS